MALEIERKFPVFDGPEDVCPQTTGFQLKYTGTDTEEELIAIPYDKLFQAKKEDKLSERLRRQGAMGATGFAYPPAERFPR